MAIFYLVIISDVTNQFRSFFHSVHVFLWFNSNVMDVVNVVIFYLVIISDVTNEFLPGDNKDLLN